ncbi:hypothetical protein F2Q69_00059025 [Brassica cretica]|uniref:Uncharacterized protein n=1 Tax=Brassica cretica TaxID=69181 RepID=A0A8S9RD93_BRACR|nr:hypothetical protein F2Q69_00059025 [Brassica cretica]
MTTIKYKKSNREQSRSYSEFTFERYNKNGGKHEMGSLRSSGDSIEGWTRMHGLMSYRRFGRARSLRSDRASARARSLRSDPFRALVRCLVFPPQSFS